MDTATELQIPTAYPYPNVECQCQYHATVARPSLVNHQRGDMMASAGCAIGLQRLQPAESSLRLNAQRPNHHLHSFPQWFIADFRAVGGSQLETRSQCPPHDGYTRPSHQRPSSPFSACQGGHVTAISSIRYWNPRLSITRNRLASAIAVALAGGGESVWLTESIDLGACGLAEAEAREATSGGARNWLLLIAAPPSLAVARYPDDKQTQEIQI